MDPAIRLSMHVVEVTPKTRWVFVEVTTRAGLRGAGEGSLNGQEAEVVAAVRALAPAVFGLDNAGPAPLSPPEGLAQAASVSALDQALWDVAAQRAGTGLAAALGGERRATVPLYANINRRTRDRSPAGFAASARDAVAAGYAAVKIAPFDEVAPGAARVPGAPGPGLARIEAVREAIGPARDLLVDCHWRLDEAEAAMVIQQAPHLYWLECPLPETAETLPALRRLRGLANTRGMRLAGCEKGIGAAGFEPFLHAGAYDAMMPDVKYVGGLSEMLRLADRFASAGVAFSPHNPTGPVCHAASLQVCAAAAATDRLEVQFDETPLFGELAGGAVPAVAGGISAMPDAPGLGVRLVPEVVARLQVDGAVLERP